MLLIFIAILLFVTKDFFCKLYGIKFDSKNSGLFLSNTLAMLFGSAVLFLVAIFLNRPLILSSLTEYILAAIFGVSYILINYVLVLAMSYGPMGLTGVICGIGGILAGSIYGLICGDDVSAMIIIGAILMTVAVILITPFKNEKKSENSYQMKWFILSFLTFLINALICVVKTEGVRNRGADSITFSLWSFIFATLTGLIAISVFLLRGERFNAYLGSMKKCLTLVAISGIMGISCTLANTFQLVCIGNGTPSIIVYPITTVSANLIEAFVSVSVLKDQKMSFKIYMAYAVCIIGIILVNIG